MNWKPAFWVDTSWTLPDEAKKQLAEDLYPAEYLPGVEHACQVYLAAQNNDDNRPSAPEDGKILLEIAEKAEELAGLLNSNESCSACDRLHEYLLGAWEKGMPTTGLSVGNFNELVSELRYLAETVYRVPVVSNLGKRGRPQGTLRSAEKTLAFFLWEIYSRAHGKAPGRMVDPVTGKECGPMARVMQILGPYLGIHGTMDKTFRTISENHKELMDNK
jgi:hypothetical protein